MPIGSPLLRLKGRLAIHKRPGSTPPMPKPCKRAHAVIAHSARIGLLGHLRTQCNNNPKTSTSAKPASDLRTTTTPNTDNHFIDTPPPMIIDTILPPPPVASITVTNTTCPTPATSVATSDYLLPPTPPTPPVTARRTDTRPLQCPPCPRT
ncbi:unnamed protein product [Schistocephalus solidus]|uniref:Uncharacterized protein n=1 Tax=Schistocephalus solidus TaxID=70667 RepID=A0A183TDD8_SCHSO|nr:unnamed protein product [Schistocephalus solidus]